MPDKIFVIPFIMNWTPITKTIKPITLFITCCPVSFRYLEIIFEFAKIMYVSKQTAIIAAIRLIVSKFDVDSPARTIAAVIAPGPDIMGIANGTIEISSFSIACFLCFGE